MTSTNPSADTVSDEPVPGQPWFPDEVLACDDELVVLPPTTSKAGRRTMSILFKGKPLDYQTGMQRLAWDLSEFKNDGGFNKDEQIARVAESTLPRTSDNHYDYTAHRIECEENGHFILPARKFTTSIEMVGWNVEGTPGFFLYEMIRMIERKVATALKESKIFPFKLTDELLKVMFISSIYYNPEKRENPCLKTSCKGHGPADNDLVFFTTPGIWNTNGDRCHPMESMLANSPFDGLMHIQGVWFMQKTIGVKHEVRQGRVDKPNQPGTKYGETNFMRTRDDVPTEELQMQKRTRTEVGQV